MYELEFTPNQAKSYQVGFDLTTESVGGYVANTDYLSIDTWDNNSYVSNVVLDGGVQLSGDVISGTVTITTTNSISSDFVLNITMRYNDADNSINKTISQTIQMTNNLGGLDQVTWKFDVTGDIVATRDYDTGTETLSNVTITLFPKNQNDELPGIAVGKLDEIFDLAATTVYLDSKDKQTFQSVDIISYNYKDSNDSFIFVLSPTIKLSNEGKNADNIELVFHTTYGSTTYNAEIPWSITINESKIPDMYYIPSENKMSTEYIDIDTEGNDLLDAAEGQAYLLNRDMGISNTKTGPFITYKCTMDLYLSAMKENVSYVVQPYFSGYDISGVIIKGKYIRYFVTESKTSDVISGLASDDIYLQNGYKNGELTNSTVGSTGSMGWNEESFDYYRMKSELAPNMITQGYHRTFHFESGKTYYIYPVIGFRGVGNPVQGQGDIAKIDCDIRVALLGQKTPPKEMEGGVIGSIELTNVTFNPNNFNIEYDTDSLEAEFSIDVSDRGLYTIDPKKLNIDTFSAGSNITGLNVSMNTGTTKYENGKLNGSILIQFNPGVTMVSSTILRVSFEYNDEENSINDTIEGNITFNYLNRSIDLQSMTFNPSTVEYKNGDKTPVTTEFTITYTSQNYTPEKLNVKLISGLLADGSPTNSKFTITMSSIIIDSSAIKGTLSIVPYEYNYMETEFIYNIKIGYEDPDDPTISDSVTQQLTLLRILKQRFTLDRMDISPQTVYYNKNKKTEDQLHVDIYYTKPDDLVIGTDNLKQRGELTIFNIEDMIYHDNIVYLDETSLENCTDADTGDEGRRFDYIPLLVIDPTQDQYHRLPETAEITLEFWYRDSDNSISEFKQGEFYLTAGDLYLEYIKYSNDTNEYTVEFNPNSTETYDIISYLGYNMTLTGVPVDPSKVTLSFTREGNSSGEFRLIINDIDNEERNNRFYILLRASCNNISDTQFTVNLTYSYIDEYEAINKTITSKITFIPKKNSETYTYYELLGGEQNSPVPIDKSKISSSYPSFNTDTSLGFNINYNITQNKKIFYDAETEENKNLYENSEKIKLIEINCGKDRYKLLTAYGVVYVTFTDKIGGLANKYPFIFSSATEIDDFNMWIFVIDLTKCEFYINNNMPNYLYGGQISTGLVFNTDKYHISNKSTGNIGDYIKIMQCCGDTYHDFIVKLEEDDDNDPVNPSNIVTGNTTIYFRPGIILYDSYEDFINAIIPEDANVGIDYSDSIQKDIYEGNLEVQFDIRLQYIARKLS